MYPHMILSFALALSFSVCLPSIVEVKHRAHTYRIYCVLRHFSGTVYPVCKCVCWLGRHVLDSFIALVCLLKMSV